MSEGLVEGQRVTLAVQGFGLRTAIVDAVDGGRVVVVPMVGGDPWPSFVDGADSAIEFPGRSGLYRAVGTVQRARAGGLVFSLTGGLERIQRREWARAETTRPAQVERVDAEGHSSQLETWTLDLSAGGACLAGPKGLTVGERVTLRVRLDEQREITIAATAEVARETPDGNVGLRIEEIEEDDRERLVRFVFEQQRQAMRLASRDR